MSHHKLTENSLAIIMTGGQIADPVMQVLGSKKIIGNAEKERYRLLVSDGKYQISFAMIATQINDKITSGELSINSIIKVKKYITSMINNGGKGDRRVMVILDLEILSRGDEVGARIGDPKQLPENAASVLNQNSAPKPSASSTSNGSSNAGYRPLAAKTAPQPVMESSGDMGNQLIVPIANLSPYQNRWVIKVRVNNKSAIRTWSNSRGEGKLFSMDLADESGEIRATVFRDLVDKYYETIEIDKVYYISKCQIKIANRQFSNLNNDYEMTFNNETTVTPCLDEMSVPKTVYNFVSIDKISALEVGSIIDIIGVCKQVSDIQNITVKATGRELKKREVTILDQSNNSVALTLWGSEAESFQDHGNPIIAVRGAKINEFGGGKSVSCLVSSILKINPDVEEAHRLQGWYDNEGKTTETVNISARSGGGGMRTDWMNIADVKERKLGSGQQADYYQVKATVLLINSNNVLYKACVSDDCNKKVVDLENGLFRCEKCNKEYDRFKYRMIMSLNISDWTDNQWVSMFAGEAEKLLQMTSQEVGEQTENNKERLVAICNKANFSEYVFRCRAKMETYNDEARLKCVCMRLEPVNCKEYHAQVHAQITKALGL